MSYSDLARRALTGKSVPVDKRAKTKRRKRRNDGDLVNFAHHMDGLAALCCVNPAECERQLKEYVSKQANKEKLEELRRYFEMCQNVLLSVSTSTEDNQAGPSHPIDAATSSPSVPMSVSPTVTSSTQQSSSEGVPHAVESPRIEPGHAPVLTRSAASEVA